MQEFLSYLKLYSVWIYAGLFAFGLLRLRQFSRAWDEMRRAAFGIEREIARNKLNQAAVWLLVTVLAALAQFSLASVFLASQPDQSPLATSTLDPLATPTTTLPAGVSEPLPGTPEPGTPGAPPATAVAGCIPEQIEITSPADGGQVSGAVMLLGSASIENFGFYKYEIARPGETIWFSINAGQNPVQSGELGEWVTTVLPPGDYQLRLVVADNQGKFLPPCVIRVQVIAPTPVP